MIISCRSELTVKQPSVDQCCHWEKQNFCGWTAWRGVVYCNWRTAMFQCVLVPKICPQPVLRHLIKIYQQSLTAGVGWNVHHNTFWYTIFVVWFTYILNECIAVQIPNGVHVKEDIIIENTDHVYVVRSTSFWAFVASHKMHYLMYVPCIYDTCRLGNIYWIHRCTCVCVHIFDTCPSIEKVWYSHNAWCLQGCIEGIYICTCTNIHANIHLQTKTWSTLI